MNLNFDVLATHVASFAENVISSCTAKDSTKALQLLTFLKVSLPLLPSKVNSSLCESLLRLPTLGSSMLTLVTYQVLCENICNQKSRLEISMIYNLLQNLLQLQPNINENNIASIYLNLLSSTVVRLQRERINSNEG